MNIKQQSKLLNYDPKLLFKKNWLVKLPYNVKSLFKNAIVLAKAEGNINHAISLEKRLKNIPDNAKYFVGRTKNGSSIGYVII